MHGETEDFNLNNHTKVLKTVQQLSEERFDELKKENQQKTVDLSSVEEADYDNDLYKYLWQLEMKQIQVIVLVMLIGADCDEKSPVSDANALVKS